MKFERSLQDVARWPAGHTIRRSCRGSWALVSTLSLGGGLGLGWGLGVRLGVGRSGACRSRVLRAKVAPAVALALASREHSKTHPTVTKDSSDILSTTEVLLNRKTGMGR
jgi:hypothetical protein